MKFYVASSLLNKEMVRDVSRRLKEIGYEQTYDWTQNEQATTLEQLADIGQKEIEAVLAADVVVVLLPARNGSHIEFGIALGQGIPIYLYAPTDDINQPEKTTTFYHVKGVTKVIGSVDKLIEVITAHD